MTELELKTKNGLPPRPVFPLGSSGIVTTKLTNLAILDELRGIVDFFFPQQAKDYTSMDADCHRSLVLAAQDEMNRRQLARRLTADCRDVVCEALQTEKPMIQTNVYLRATRPNVSGVQENIGWHRESFYGPDMDQSINFWVPLANVSAENIMRYIPDSHLIPDAEIKTHSEPDASVEKFSAGHKIGLLYAPKEIVSGVDLSKSRGFVVLPGEVAIFAGHLIHGAAKNRSNSIRFSLDFRLIAEESLITAKAHFASGKNYFEAL